jgi:hypothetical protein
MFPTGFADAVVKKHTAPGDAVLDPFAGRGTSVFSAAAQGRTGVGIELNPVGWVYARTKLAPASKAAVERRLKGIGEAVPDFGIAAVSLPDFFRHCFSLRVRQFLCAARDLLRWREDAVDRTLMALVLVYLHGKREASLSNQMRQAKAMSPEYAIRWWSERKMEPPEVDPVKFLSDRLEWRYAKGIPPTNDSKVYLGDSTERLREVLRRIREGRLPRMSLLFTSPPYYKLANYHYDQWLRLWMLGGRPDALRDPEASAHQKKFEDYEAYTRLLDRVFGWSAELLKRNAVVYVRTGQREETLEATLTVLKSHFPRKCLKRYLRPFVRPTQTTLFGDGGKKQGEVDFLLT